MKSWSITEVRCSKLEHLLEHRKDTMNVTLDKNRYEDVSSTDQFVNSHFGCVLPLRQLNLQISGNYSASERRPPQALGLREHSSWQSVLRSCRNSCWWNILGSRKSYDALLTHWWNSCWTLSSFGSSKSTSPETSFGCEVQNIIR